MAVMADFKRVFEIGPVFRAENSYTHRHMCIIYLYYTYNRWIHWVGSGNGNQRELLWINGSDGRSFCLHFQWNRKKIR